MPRLLKRFIYDDDGTQMAEGSTVMIDDRLYIIYFDSNGQITIRDCYLEDHILSPVEVVPEDADIWPEIVFGE